MSDVRVETTDTIDHLRTHILTDHELAAHERRQVGCIRLVSVRRYEVRLQMESRIVHFRLSNPNFNGRRCLLNDTGNSALHGQAQHKLAWHKAAEALLAIRKGHMEYRRNRALKADPLELELA
ncbi:hypothetical protein EXS62_02270 [Candidatus Kaiserbacteria bacterium]|nr:hypothetical protein [Candidatus Kaiserbacteria bacterium]